MRVKFISDYRMGTSFAFRRYHVTCPAWLGRRQSVAQRDLSNKQRTKATKTICADREIISDAQRICRSCS